MIYRGKFMTANKKRIYTFIAATAMALSLCISGVSFADGYYESWEQYSEGSGITSYTWNDVMDAMEELLNEASDDYAAGDADTALKKISAVKNNYWGTSGMKVEMQQRLTGSSKRAVEADFKNLNHAINDGESADDVATDKDVLVADLRLAANKLDGVEIEVDIIEETEAAAEEASDEEPPAE